MMRVWRRVVLACAWLLWLPAAAAGQQDDPARITLDRLFGTPDFAPKFFGPARWIENGAAYTTLEDSEATRDAQDIVRYDAVTGTRQVLVPASRLVAPAATQPLDIEDYSWSPDARMLLVFTSSEKVWRDNTRGDYWVLDMGSGALRKLGRDAPPSTLMFATFSPDGGRVAYVRQNNLYVENLADSRITQLTNDGSRTVINGTFDWVYEEELGLQNGFRWSPDGNRIAYWQLDAAGVRDFNLINNTDSLYSFVVPVQYPKAGTTNSAGRVGVVPAAGGDTRWLEAPGDPRNNYIARLEWAASSEEVILQHLNRLQNTNTVMLGDASSGRVRTILVERDSAWLDVVDDWKWLDDGKRFSWISERDGWRHVYTVSRDGKTVRLVTPGDFDVISVKTIDEKGGFVYYTASPENPAQRYLFRSRLDGRGKPERITPAQPGTHNYTIAPGAALAFHTHSSVDVPPTTDLVRLPKHEAVRVLEDNTKLKANVAGLRRRPTEFFRIDTDAGVALDGWIMKPADFDPARKYPVLFFVYGEPASQTALDQWSFVENLWHLSLVQEGYLVVTVDNRGTPAPRGRAFRKSIYGKVGILNSQDQAAAARAIARWPFVDAQRFAVWGWSGGGSMTLNLMFRSPELYKVGMSVAPVADERFYDTIYQERYMGLPSDNAEGYRLGSPITHADKLQGKLLVIHGTGDDNVHYQNTEALVNRLIEANKPFTMMAYPNRTHCICEGKGTYRHLFTLLNRFLHENLPATPGPTGMGTDR
jgi:dipeptidyl-peptidase-4